MKNVIQGTTLSGTGAVSIAPGAEITIRNPAGQLVPLWADRAGTQPHDNPFLTDNEGNFRVYADSGWVHVRAQKNGSVREWRYVPIGSAAAMNIGEVYAALGSEIYSSVSDGLSNSAEGDYFLVESSGSLDLYRVVNGAAEQREQGIDADAVLATRAYADGVAAEAESNATNAAVAAASSAYQLATQYSDNELQTHRESGDHDFRYYTKAEVDQALSTKVDDDDPRLSDAREWTASTVSQAEAEAGTSTTRRAWTAQRVRQAIVAAYNALTSAFGRTLANASDATAARNTLGLGTAATRDVGTGANNVVVGSDPRLSDAREWTAEVVSQAEAEAGTSSVPRKWTAERVRQAIEALGGGGIDLGNLDPNTEIMWNTPAGDRLGVIIQKAAGSSNIFFGEPNRTYIRVSGPSYALYPSTIMAVADNAFQAKITNSGVAIGPIDTLTFGRGTLNAANGLYDGGVRVVRESRTISTGTGLTGGGDLSSNRTISLASSHIPIGVGQTWQDVTAERAWATTYTNTTDRPIAVYIRTASVQGNVNIFLTISGVTLYGPEFLDMPGSKSASIFAIIPPGAYYAASSNRELFQWYELR